MRFDPGMIYRLESPDLSRIAPGRIAPDIGRGEGRGKGDPSNAPPLLHAKRGLPFRALKAGSRDWNGWLDFHTLQGRKIRTLHSGEPDAALELSPGMYLLRTRHPGAVHRLWVE